MSLSMYQASIPVLIHNLKTLSAILKKGAAHAKARGIDPVVLFNARLYPDMFALSRQVQIAADMAKGGAARLAGVEIPSFAEITLQMRMGAVTFPGQYYLLSWVLPNVLFHITTAYNILRHNGVELGKWDFLGKAPGAVIGGSKRAKTRRKAASGKVSRTKR